MRLGDLDALKVHISELMLVYKGTELNNAILNAIDNAPTVEINTNEIEYKAYCKGLEDGKKITRPQGKWVGNSFDEHHCNRCGHFALWEEEPDGYYEVQSNFCPECGADMRGEENETAN